MTQYSAGQTVEVVTDEEWSLGFQNGNKIVLERLIPDDEVFAGEWDARASNGVGGIIAEKNFKPMSTGPVRTETVTKRRIVPGVYGRLEVRGRDDDCVTLLLASRGGKIDKGFAHILNATELDDLAMVASQLAEALRDVD